MPFTPFHLGPGALFKAIGGAQFSFVVFGGAQVLMDVEPLVHMVRGDAVLHGISHTIAGAFVIAMVAAVVGRPVGNFMLQALHVGTDPIGWRGALISAFVGTYSHIGLDAVMHRDMNPFWPIADGNDLLGAVSVRTLHLLSIASGLVGGTIVLLRAMRDA